MGKKSTKRKWAKQDLIEFIRRSVEDGLSLAQCARLAGVTKPRIYQVSDLYNQSNAKKRKKAASKQLALKVPTKVKTILYLTADEIEQKILQGVG